MSDIERLKRECDMRQNDYMQLCREFDALNAENARLRAALENAIGRLDGCAFAQKVGGHTTKDLKAALAGKDKDEP